MTGKNQRSFLRASLLACLLLVPLAAAIEGNKVDNSGFEADANADGVPDAWTLTGSSGCTLGRSSDAYQGNWSGNLSGAAGVSCGAVSTRMNVTGGLAYASLVQFKGFTDSTATYGSLVIRFYDANGNFLNSAGASNSRRCADWCDIRVARIAPLDAATADIAISVSLTEHSPRLYGLFDAAIFGYDV